MNPEDAERQIRQRIIVTPQRVMIAKAIILDLAKTVSSSVSLSLGFSKQTPLFCRDLLSYMSRLTHRHQLSLSVKRSLGGSLPPRPYGP
jgi:hypothetical protein